MTKHWKVRSRLYRSRLLHLNVHFASVITKMCRCVQEQIDGETNGSEMEKRVRVLGWLVVCKRPPSPPLRVVLLELDMQTRSSSVSEESIAPRSRSMARRSGCFRFGIRGGSALRGLGMGIGGRTVRCGRMSSSASSALSTQAASTCMTICPTRAGQSVQSRTSSTCL